jgi:hypothetical protein
MSAGRAEILAAFDETMRMSARDPGAQTVSLDGVVLSLGRSPEVYDNYVTWSRLDEGAVDAAIDAVVARFGGRDFEWKVFGHDTPADLGARLARRGFVADVPETMVAIALDGAREAGPLPAGIRVARAIDDAGFDDVGRVWDAIEEGASTRRALAIEHAEDPDAISISVAYDGARPVAAAWTRFHPGTPFATLWGGGTIAPCRGRGIYRALVGVRIDEARVRGFRYATVDARETSRPILERVGFVPLTGVTGYLWKKRGAR